MLTGAEIVDRIESLVHADTQLTDHGLELTVRDVYGLVGSGRLDFGGSEFERAPRERLEPALASPDDDYGWWHLESGAYLVVYNEIVALEKGEVARIDPLERLLDAGASHASRSFSGSPDELSSLLFVSPAGCHLKENCRISRLTIANPG